MNERVFRILIAEDDPGSRILFNAILQGEGYAVEIVQNGSDVEERVTAFRPDLILMDIDLPGLSGPEVLARLRRRSTTAESTIVALTAHAMKGDDERFLAMGFDAYIPKPIKVKGFRTIVRRFLESRAAEHPPGGESHRRRIDENLK